MNSSRKIAFIDESSILREGVQKYRVCAVIVHSTDSENIRGMVRPLLLKGQRKFHWTDERKSRRDSFLKAIALAPFKAVIVIDVSAPRRHEERQRRKCLELLYTHLEFHRVNDLVLEARTSTQDQMDIAHIAGLKNSGAYRRIRLTHTRGGDEPLLWIPDVLLGAHNARHQNAGVAIDLMRDPRITTLTTSGD